MRCLGIDPSLRGTGYAVLDWNPGGKVQAVGYGVIKIKREWNQTVCLCEIFETMTKVVGEFRPDTAAVEGVIYVQNNRTAVTLGAARGAALLAVARAGIPVYEYAAKRIKKAGTGVGAAAKGQVAFMMRAILGLRETPGPDEADALAIGLTHAQAQASIASKGGKRL